MSPSPRRAAGLPSRLLARLRPAGAPQGQTSPMPERDGAAPGGERRPRKADLTIALETARDDDETAALACEGFGVAPGTFRPDVLRWLYDTAFSDGTTVLAAHAGGRKVGHIALVHQTLVVAGRRESAVALVDLFILKAFRSRAAMAALYGAVEALCLDRRIGFIVAVPNVKAAGVNARYLKLAEAARLDIRVGLAGLPRPWHRIASHRVAELDPDRGQALLEPFCGGDGAGLLWTAPRLWARLGRPGAGYALHAGRDLLVVSAPRRQGRAPHTMICALLARPGAAPGRGAVAAAVSAACRLHGRPLFVYAGLNAAVPRPGLLLPERLRPSPMVLQTRDLRPEPASPLAVARFEAIDFDFI